MGKISKNSNLYDKDGNLLKHVNEDGVLEDYTTKELEELLKTFVEDNKIIDQEKYDNVMSILMQRYQTANDEDSIFKRIEEYIKTKTTSDSEVQDALNQVKESLYEPSKVFDTTDESTIEEIKDDESTETISTTEVQGAVGANNATTDSIQDSKEEEIEEITDGISKTEECETAYVEPCTEEYLTECLTKDERDKTKSSTGTEGLA